MISTADDLPTDDLDALLDAIFEDYHYDFRAYARASLLRGVTRAKISLGASSIHGLIRMLSDDPAVFSELLRHLTIQVSDFFRDPNYFAAFRNDVVPHLATYPSLRIWVPGCGTGEEAYSIAIILHEEGLLERSLIYATDIAAHALETAATGIYDIGRVRGFSENYFQAGGRASLSDYYRARDSSTAFSRMLRRHILFSDHSLATDSVFAEVQMVSCRNVLIYFDRDLQTRAVDLFREAICPRGFLGLGANETLVYTEHARAFEPFAAAERIYRLREKTMNYRQ